MKLAIAGFLHESNTFNPTTTGRTAFEVQGLTRGDDVHREWADAHHEIGGFLEGAGRFGYQPVALGVAVATPSGPVEQSFFDEWVDEIVRAVADSGADGLLLALHGAMVTTGCRDADTEVLVRLRARVGPDYPLAVTFDLHANLSPGLQDVCRLATSYRTNPHLDQRQTGLRAAELLTRWLRGEITPHLAVAKPATLVNIMRQDSSEGAFRRLLTRARELEQRDGAVVVDFLPGFAYGDVPHMGPSVLVTANSGERACELAATLAEEIWAARADFQAELPGPAEAVRRAMASRRPPAVIVDTGDNVGGGSAGDSTALLSELLQQGATGWVMCLHAPDAVRQCAAGATVELNVGTPPVAVRGIVRRLHSGEYLETQPRHGGKRHNHMGLTALIEVSGGSYLVLNSQRHPPFSLGALTCLEINPAEMRILVVKAAIAYKAAYAPLGGEIIEADTPGLTAINPARFDYRHARVLYPLDVPFDGGPL